MQWIDGTNAKITSALKIQLKYLLPSCDTLYYKQTKIILSLEFCNCVSLETYLINGNKTTNEFLLNYCIMDKVQKIILALTDFLHEDKCVNENK